MLIFLFPLGHEAGELALEADFGGGGHAVDEKDAVEVIDLVLEGTGEEAVGLHRHGFAIECHEGDGDGFGAADVTAEAGKAQAAFFAGFFGVAELELGIEKHDGHVLHHFGWLSVDLEIGDGVRAMSTINHGELHILRYLWRGQADAIGLTHGFEHIRRELTDLGRDLRHGAAFGTKNGLGMANNGKNHVGIYPEIPGAQP